MTSAGTTARLLIVLPEDVAITPAKMVPTMLPLGQRMLEMYQLTVQELPEVEVTAVERVKVVPADAVASGFTVGVANDLAARASWIVLDSDLLLSNDGRVLLTAATLFAGAEHLLEIRDRPARQYTSGKPRHRRTTARTPSIPRQRSRPPLGLGGAAARMGHTTDQDFRRTPHTLVFQRR